jgi:intracellular sulfur oxidation DsrE/DsrF family protein
MPAKKNHTKHIIKALEQYLAEKYLFQEDYDNFTVYRIVEHKRLKHGVIIKGYSSEFIRLINEEIDPEISISTINASIKRLKKANSKLYDSLNVLRGKPVEKYMCHKSTVYRRLKKALLFIAIDAGLLTNY